MSSGILDAKLRKSDRMREDTRWAETLRHSSSDDGDSVASGDDHAATESPSTSKKRSKTKKRQKKVRSWAGAILTRGKVKRKDDMAGSKSSPSPVLTRTNSDLGSGLDVNFDDDNVVVIRTPTNPTSPDSHSPSDNADAPASLENSWKPRSFYEQGRQNDVLSPIIDLDAALGPFNTPDMGSSGTAKSGFSAATKRMYSGGRRGEFVGPEMRYHRRTESAPEMPPFDRSFLNNRLVNNSALENPDVFYEEEEDAFLAATSENDERGPLQGVAGAADQQSLESKESSDTLTRQPGENFANPQEQTGLGIQKQEPDDAPDSLATCSNQENQNPTDQQSASDQLRDARNPFSNQPKSPVELIKHEDWLRKVPVPPSPDISPRFLPTDRPATSPIDFTPNIPIPPLSLQGGTSVSNSPFPSPDFAGSSPDFPRSITTSSTTDRNFSSPSYNPSMEFPHASADDVPSLTSSASTTTNTLNRFSATFFQRSRLSTDRSASFSAAGNRRNSQANSSKRSSLASLSKLFRKNDHHEPTWMLIICT
ncbi:hypothetical protein EYZ11_000033 [Aspergillus tanneri]|uniref:Cell wall proline rich protein n=1 Tax=Aspergillus tanneri TaxID=1220188 RepID=A0A4S3JY37_9EURO|nr:hypothetical protein EYZ11_000033 [Aspergillus tanneri]